MIARLKTFLYGVGCFLLPAAILALAAAVCGLYPFGDKLFMLNDMNAQYVDFFAWYRDVLAGNACGLYSTSQALGQNMVGTISYYLASPLNITVLLFSERDIPIFFFIITLAKVGLICLAMVFYLRRRFALSRIWACALALSFALSLWVLMQVRNIMWIDALILLPLCAWGVCCLLRHGRWRLLAITTAATVITCWYMAYMVILFLCLYVLFEGYALGFEGVPSQGRTHIRRLALFAGCMALSLALAAFLFLPTVLGMAGDGATGEEGSAVAYLQGMLDKHLPTLGLSAPLVVTCTGAGAVVVIAAVMILFRRYSLRRRLAGLLFGALALLSALALFVPAMQQESLLQLALALFCGGWTGSLYLNDNVPQLFGSALVVVLCILFFASRRVPTKLKLACALMLFLLIASTWLRPLMIIWGGMRLPHGYQSRMAFFAVFMLIWAAAFALRALSEQRALEANGPGVCAVLRRVSASPAFAAVILILTVGELAVRSCLVWGSLYQEAYMEWVNDYYDSAIVQAAELEEHDPGIYRTEKTYPRYNSLGFSEGMTYGFNQLASYSSTNSQAVLAFLSALGYGNGEYCTYDLDPSPVVDSLLGVKYLSAVEAPPHCTDAGLTPVSYDGARFWENPFALALGYGASPDVVGFEMPDADRWTCMNAFADAVWGRDVPLYLTEDAPDDAAPSLDMDAFTQMISELSEHPFIFDAFGGSHISGTLEADDDQVLLMTIPNQDGWSVTVNGEAVQPMDVADGALMAIPVSAGENHVEMRFAPPGLVAGCILSAMALLVLLVAPTLYGQRSRIDRSKTGTSSVENS